MEFSDTRASQAASRHDLRFTLSASYLQGPVVTAYDLATLLTPRASKPKRAYDARDRASVAGKILRGLSHRVGG